MFSIAFYDKKNKELFLIRDRYGVKPLYYTIEDDTLYFASELKPLFALKKSLKKNNRYYKNFLTDTVSDHDNQTPVNDIFQVRPGHYLKLSKTKNIVEKKWYYFNDYYFNEHIFKSKKKTLLFFENLLIDSIKLRLKSDVPVCLTLSGGIDSSVLYTLIREKLKKKISVFFLKIDNPLLDESKIVTRLLKKYKDKYHLVKINKSNNLKNLISNIRSLEFPIWDTSSVAYSEVYKKINIKKYKVVIEGHGSDEQLGGYPYLINSGILSYFYKFKIKDSFKILHVSNNSIINSSFSNFIFIFEQTIKSLLKKFIKKNEPFFFDEKIKASFNYKVLPIVLRTFDRLTMKYSIENRCPFLDYRVVEFLRKLPMKYKINSLGSKAILREVLKKYENNFVYENSKKIGFTGDIVEFFRVNKKQIEKIIINSDFNFIKKKKYLNLLRKKFLNENKYVDLVKNLQVFIFDKIFDLKNKR